jgi:hypothetical protein
MGKRSEIKNALQTMLLGNTEAGLNVYKSRFLPLDKEDDLPAICIYITKENVSVYDSVKYKKTAELIVECICSGSSADADIDSLSNEVEDLIRQDETLTGNVDSIELISGEGGFDENSKDDIQGWRLIYNSVYYENRTVDDPIDDLEKIKIEYNNNDFSDEVNYED